ncbi:MAG: type II toxin-antitoxin system RelE/ParE family toxin [Gemmataceae bacterium]|nr:type II toxin-antitoxin system RelE/ParE family toxin [Gemmataceae bacterium]
MSLPVTIRRAAKLELAAAGRWYNQQRPGLGDDLLARVQESLDRISALPKLHQVVFKDVRRAPVVDFEYGVYYRVLPNRIVVIGIVHGRRNPEIWKKRV